MSKRRLGAVIVIGALFVAGLAGYLYLTSPKFGMTLLGYLERQVAQFGIDIEAASVQLSASAPHLRIDKLSLTKRNDFEALVRRFELTVKSAQLGMPNEIESARLDGVVFVVHLPKQPPQQSEKASTQTSLQLPSLDLDFSQLPFGIELDAIEVQDAVLIVQRGNQEIARIGPFSFEATRITKLGFKLSALAKSAEASNEYGAPIQANDIKLSAELKRRSILVRSVSLKTNFGELLLNANWADLRTPKLQVEVQASAELEKLSKVFEQLLPAMQGNLELVLSATLNQTISSSQVRGTAKLDTLRIQTEEGTFKIDSASIPFAWKDDQLDLTQANLCLTSGGCVELSKARIQTTGNWQASIEANLKNVELARVLDATTITGSYVMLKISGPTKLKGTLRAPFLLLGNVDVTTSSFLLFNHSFQAPRTPNDLIMSISSAHVKTAIRIDSKRVRLTDGVVRRGKSVMRIIRNDLNYDGTFYLEYESNQLSLPDIGKIAGLSFGGVASRLHVVIAGPYNDPKITSTATVRSFELEGIKAGDLRLQQYYYDGVLRFTDVETVGGKRLQANLKLDFNPEELAIEADFYSEGMRVEQVVSALGLKKIDIRGEFYGAGEVRGPISALSGTLSGAFADLVAYGVKVPKLRLNAQLERDGTITINDAEARFGKGQIKVSGSIARNGKLAFEAFSRNLRLSQIEQIAKTAPEFDAAVQLVASLKGSLKTPQLEASVHLSKVRYSSANLEDCSAQVRLNGNQLTVVADLLGNQAQISFDTNLSSQDTKIVGHVKSLDLAALLKGADVNLDAGSLSANFEAAGNLSKPETFAGSVELTQGKITWNGVALRIKADAPLRLQEGRLALSGLHIYGPDELTGAITGYVQLNGLAYELLLAGTANFSLLKRLTHAEGLQSAGKLDYKLTISGSSKAKTVLDGSAVLTEGVLVWNGVLPRLENIEAGVVFSGRSIELERFKAVSGGGTVSAAGELALSQDWKLASTNISIAMRKVKLELAEHITPILDADLSLTGSSLPLKLKGDAHVVSLRYTHDIPWETRLFENLSRIFSPRRKVRILRRDRKPTLAFDINIYGKDSIKIYNNLAQIDFTADLKLVGNDTAVGLLGSLSASKGVLKFQTRDFLIRSFIVRFTESDRIFAEFNVLAETDPIEYVCGPNEGTTRITVRIKGNEDSYQVEYSADAIDLIDKTQVWSVLVAGDCGMREATFESSMKNLVGGIITNPFEKSFGVDTRIVFEPVQTISGTTKVVPRFTIGKRLTPNMTIIYSSTFAEEEGNDRRIEIRYRKKNFSMSGEWSSGTVLKQGGLGIELIYHFEF